MTDEQVEKVARALRDCDPNGDDADWEEYITDARAAIAAMPPALSPKLIDKLNKLATYLTEQGEFEACDLIDTVVARLTPALAGSGEK